MEPNTPSKYINREVSWLKFNARVLQEASDPSVPLLERIRFLGIYSNNQDEFFKVRYAKLLRALENNSSFPNIVASQSKEELLDQINSMIWTQQNTYDTLYEALIEALKLENIHLVNELSLLPEHKSYIQEYFKTKLSHSIVVLILNSLNNHKVSLQAEVMYLAVKMVNAKEEPSYALIEVPSDIFPRFLVLKSVQLNDYVIYLEDVIRYHLKDIFKMFDFVSIEAHALKISRDAELWIDDDLKESFVNKIAKSVESRKEGETVRMVYDKDMAKDTLEMLKGMLSIDNFDNLSPGGRYHSKKDLMKFPDFNRKDLLYTKIQPLLPQDLANVNSYFSAIAQKDHMIYAPFDDYSVLLKFLREAAIDPKVTKIKMTLYRLASDSQVISALVNAAKNGKKVTAILELRARFDEANNVKWSKVLQEAGAEVIFGVPQLKVHSKVGLIERLEKGQKKYYGIFSTGNFHGGTAKIYTDFTLFTSHSGLCTELVSLFEFFRANYKIKSYQHLMVSPMETREKLYKLIDQEIQHRRKGKPAQISIKVNSLSDKGMIDKLYQASEHGVEVRLVIRGICCLIPQKEFSQNIKAISVVDKFLEHPRMYWFKNGGEDLVYLSSADLMERNIDNRVEVAFPVLDKKLQKQVQDIFDLSFKDNVKGRIHNEELFSETYQRDQNQPIRSQELIYYYLKFLDQSL
ncbi:MAG: polyphosphate kinase 1 [Flavobacteriaceae bacterium]|nr:MAG: polyphosphate kinase 1 [Flavobacteriaceae bacterium]